MGSMLRIARREFAAYFSTPLAYVCLVTFLVAAGLLIWGQNILQPVLTGYSFIAYWTTCFGFTLLAIIAALLDVHAMRRRAREAQRELARRTLALIEADRSQTTPSAKAASSKRPELTQSKGG